MRVPTINVSVVDLSFVASRATNSANYELPFKNFAKSDATALRQAIRLWNALPEEMIGLDKKAFYAELKRMEGMRAFLQNFAIYQYR